MLLEKKKAEKKEKKEKSELLLHFPTPVIGRMFILY